MVGTHRISGCDLDTYNYLLTRLDLVRTKSELGHVSVCCAYRERKREKEGGTRQWPTKRETPSWHPPFVHFLSLSHPASIRLVATVYQPYTYTLDNKQLCGWCSITIVDLWPTFQMIFWPWSRFRWSITHDKHVLSFHRCIIYGLAKNALFPKLLHW